MSDDTKKRRCTAVYRRKRCGNKATYKVKIPATGGLWHVCKYHKDQLVTRLEGVVLDGAE